ncbi:MAG: helicase HerA-like domain-containing protein [Anaerolineae bacterium]
MQELRIAKGTTDLIILSNMANRHGLIAGATGTGKTVTLQTIAEHFSEIGVPVFMADVKGDLAGLSKAGGNNNKVTERLALLGITDHQYRGYPIKFWDLFGKNGHPVRTTISEMGPLLLSRLMNLSEVQEGVLTLVFQIADDNGLLLLDLKDLRAMLSYVGENAKQFTTDYGNISAASIGAIQRGLAQLEEQGGEHVFGEPALDIFDMMQTDTNGYGYINILAADQLMQSPRVYSTWLLWLLSELFERLPEVGDLEKPKMVYFFDEAHLLFDDTSKALIDKIEQVTRLIRSKGIGVFFVTQNPIDIPDTVLGQLGNRVQHALRAYTPRDQKAIKTAAETFRANPAIDVVTVITELGVGEGLISFLDGKGAPSMVDRGFVIPPHSQIGPIAPEERAQLMRASLVYGHYEQAEDRESAYEKLKARAEKVAEEAAKAAAEKQAEKDRKAKEKEERARRKDKSIIEDVFVGSAKSAVRSAVGQVTRSFIRGILGGLK